MIPKKYLAQLQEMCAKNFKTILSVAVLVAAGGLSTLFIGTVGSIIVPAWIVFMAFVLRKGYKK